MEIIIASNADEEMMEIYITDKKSPKRKEILFFGNDWDFNRDSESIKEFIEELCSFINPEVKVKLKKLKRIG